MDEPQDDFLVPRRVTEVGVPACQWDIWSQVATRAFRRARLGAVLAALVVGIALATAGLVLTPGASRASIAAYALVAAAAVWVGTRRLFARWGLVAVVKELRAVVVPALVESIGTDALVGIVRDGGTLMTSRGIVIVAHRRDGLIVVVASEYDLSALPGNPFAEQGFSGGP